MFVRIIFGIIMAGFGVLMTIKSNVFLGVFGTIDWMEEFLGSSILGYKLFGILLFFIGVLVSTGLINKIILSVFGRFMGM